MINTTMTVDEIIAMLSQALYGFVRDPADSDHQEGYQAALEETYRAITGRAWLHTAQVHVLKRPTRYEG